jgi:hypothetical protein
MIIIIIIIIIIISRGVSVCDLNLLAGMMLSGMEGFWKGALSDDAYVRLLVSLGPLWVLDPSLGLALLAGLMLSGMKGFLTGELVLTRISACGTCYAQHH